MVKILFIFLGGGFGAVSRYLLSMFISQSTSTNFPAGTILVNIFGSFLIGLLWEFFNYEILSPELRSFIFIGFIGGFTTFSTYMLETFNLIANYEYKFAIIYFLITNILGFIFLLAGVFLARYLLHIR